MAPAATAGSLGVVPDTTLPNSAASGEARRYRVRLAAGARTVGEAQAELGGEASQWPPPHWLFEWQRRWDLALWDWRPLARVRLEPAGCAATLRLSRSLLPGASPEERRALDGTGLDLHLDTQLARPWPVQAELPGELELAGLASRRGGPPLALRQAVELELGPEGQARCLNLTLPVGLLLGAALGPHVAGGGGGGSGGAGARLGPLGVYASFSAPGRSALRGWAWEGEAQDARAGALRAQASRPWGRAPGGGAWAVEHLRRHGAVQLPLPAASLRDIAPALAGAAAVPTTRLRVSSEGNSAACSLESSQAGLGGPSWGGSVEANRFGWGARLCLTAGNRQGGFGQPQYAVTTRAPWDGFATIAHEVKWTFADGQGFWVTVQDAGQGARVNAGLEIR